MMEQGITLSKIMHIQQEYTQKSKGSLTLTDELHKQCLSARWIAAGPKKAPHDPGSLKS